MDPGCHAWPRRMSLPSGEAQLAGCQKDWQVVRWRKTQASSGNAKGVIQNTSTEIGVYNLMSCHCKPGIVLNDALRIAT